MQAIIDVLLIGMFMKKKLINGFNFKTTCATVASLIGVDFDYFPSSLSTGGS